MKLSSLPSDLADWVSSKVKDVADNQSRASVVRSHLADWKGDDSLTPAEETILSDYEKTGNYIDVSAWTPEQKAAAPNLYGMLSGAPDKKARERADFVKQMGPQTTTPAAPPGFDNQTLGGFLWEGAKQAGSDIADVVSPENAEGIKAFGRQYVKELTKPRAELPDVMRPVKGAQSAYSGAVAGTLAGLGTGDPREALKAAESAYSGSDPTQGARKLYDLARKAGLPLPVATPEGLQTAAEWLLPEVVGALSKSKIVNGTLTVAEQAALDYAVEFKKLVKGEIGGGETAFRFFPGEPQSLAAKAGRKKAAQAIPELPPIPGLLRAETAAARAKAAERLGEVPPPAPPPEIAKPLPPPLYTPEDVKLAATKRAAEGDAGRGLAVPIPEGGDIAADVQRASLQRPGKGGEVAPLDVNEAMMNIGEQEGGLFRPHEGTSGFVEDAQVLKPEKIPSARAAKAADRELAMKMNPNTVHDLQQAALVSKDTDPLAVRLGVAPAGHQNDLLTQLKDVVDKPLPLMPPGVQVATKEQKIGEVMRTAWGKVAARGVGGNLAHPVQMLDDLFGAAGLKPAWDRMVVKPFRSVVPESARNWAARKFSGSAGLEPANFLAYQRAQQDESFIVRDLTNMITEKLGKDVTPEESNLLEGLLRGNIEPKHVLPTERNMELLKRYADTREALDTMGDSLVQMGLLDKDVFMQNIGKYLPQYYKGTELETAWQKMMKAATSPIKTIGDRLRPRKLQWEQLRLTAEGKMKMREMGAIENPAYSAAKASLDIGQDLANARFSRRIALDETLASKTPKTGGPEGDWVQLNGKAYGDLNGMFVHPDVAAQVTDLHKWTTKGKALQIYDQMLGVWKLGKTAWNPATWSRNGFTNAWLFEGATGRSWLDPRQWGFFKDGIKEWASGDTALYKEMERRGALGMGGGERQTRDALRKMLDESTGNTTATMFERVMAAPGKGYRSMDDINRFLLAKHAQSEGMALQDIVAFAKKHGIDYGAVGPYIQNLSRGIPFIKYPYKAFPLIAEYLLKRPATMAKYPAMLAAMAYYAKKRAGWTAKDEENANKLLDNGWTANRRLFMIPYKSDDGTVHMLDTSFFVDASLSPLGHPAVSLAEAALNKDSFTGKEIYSKADEASGRKYFKLSDFFFKKLAPSLLPGPGAVIPSETALTPTGGYSADKIVNTWRNRADYLGRQRNMAQVLADVILGIKVMPMRFDEVADFKRRDLMTEIKALGDQNIKFGNRMDAAASDFEKKTLQANIDRNNAAIEAKTKELDAVQVPGEQAAPAVPEVKRKTKATSLDPKTVEWLKNRRPR